MKLHKSYVTIVTFLPLQPEFVDSFCFGLDRCLNVSLTLVSRGIDQINFVRVLILPNSDQLNRVCWFDIGIQLSADSDRTWLNGFRFVLFLEAMDSDLTLPDPDGRTYSSLTFNGLL